MHREGTTGFILNGDFTDVSGMHSSVPLEVWQFRPLGSPLLYICV